MITSLRFICGNCLAASHKSFLSLGDSVGGSETGPSVGAGPSVGVGASVGAGVASEQAPMLLQSSWGLRLSLTSPSMIAGIWDSIKDLQIASGTRAESRSQTWGTDCNSKSGTFTFDFTK